MIRVGIGGWIYEPWRGSFYPKGLPKTQELAHASRRVSAIEINSTFYSLQKPATFRRWAEETPDDFVFALKAPRLAVNRRVLAEAGPSLERFFASGLTELKGKLGPILWQLAPTKKYDAADIAGLLALLPRNLDGLKLRHVIEVRHDSFLCAEFVEQARKTDVAIAFADSEKHPQLADLTSDFVYARLQRCEATEPTGYPVKALDGWAAHARAWSRGKAPAAFPLLAPEKKSPKSRDVFVFFIAGSKERAPAAAEALLERLQP